MIESLIYRLFYILILVVSLGISGYYRAKARQSGEVITRAQEGAGALVLRGAGALVLYLSLLAYAINPNWMAWSQVDLPAWIRWAGVLFGLVMDAAVLWLFVSIGRNISETVLTKSDQELVTHGPYRWVRHPLYTVGSMLFLALGLIAANWFIMLLALAVLTIFRVFVIPAEEQRLIAQFGESYRVYMQRTGAVFPRLLG